METLDEVLKHYGVKGMKWGVRRYQPYPKGEAHKGTFLNRTINRKQVLSEGYQKRGISARSAETLAKRRRRGELILAGVAAVALTAGAVVAYKAFGRNFIDKTIKPGTVIQNLTGTKDRDLSKPFYAAFKKRDKMKYQGLFGGGHLEGVGGNTVFKNVLKSPKPIRVASHNNARKALERTVNSNETFKAQFRRMTGTSRVNKQTYEEFNKAIPVLHAADYKFRGSNSVKPFYDNLKKMGYNGLLDINDQKFSGYAANSPTIIFDMGKDAVQSVSRMSVGQIKAHYNREAGLVAARALAPTTIGTIGLVGAGSVLDVDLAARALEDKHKKAG